MTTPAPSPAGAAPSTPGAPHAAAASPGPALPQQPIVIQTHGTFHRVFGWIGWLGFGICSLMLIGYVTSFAEYFNTTGGVSERFHSGAKFGSDKIAIIDIAGVIMEGDGFVKQQIDLIREDERVKAVVVRVESPGGTVTGSDYIFHHLRKLKKERNLKLVVSMGSIAASGGYYVSMAVGDEERAIFAEPTSTTGSIGVIIPHYDITKLMERFDVRDDSIASHPRKQMLSMTKALSDDDRRILQEYVNESFQRFKSIVREGRPKLAQDDEALTRLATGEVFTAGQALKNGLVDEIGFIEDAIDRATELAGLNKDNVRVVRYQRPPSLFGLSGFAESRGASGGTELSTLLELSAPRAYYLATSLPTLVTSRRAD